MMILNRFLNCGNLLVRRHERGMKHVVFVTEHHKSFLKGLAFIFMFVTIMIPILPHDNSPTIKDSPVISKNYHNFDLISTIHSVKNKVFLKQVSTSLFVLFPSFILYANISPLLCLYPCILLLIRRLYLRPLKFTSIYV